MRGLPPNCKNTRKGGAPTKLENAPNGGCSHRTAKRTRMRGQAAVVLIAYFRVRATLEPMSLDLFPKRPADGQPGPITEEMLAKAKRRWVWIGVFCWGVPMFVVMDGRDVYQSPEYFLYTGRGISTTALGLLLWLACGYIWGYWMWWWMCCRKRHP